MICFLTNERQSVHLVVVKNESVSDLDLPTMTQVKVSNCYHCPVTDWNVVRWRDAKHTYILLAKDKASKKEELVQFF